jgi:hypothetical protein
MRGAFELGAIQRFAMDSALELLPVKTISSRPAFLQRWFETAPLHTVAVLAIVKPRTPASLTLRTVATKHAAHAHIARLPLDGRSQRFLSDLGVYSTPALLVFRSLTPAGLKNPTVHRGLIGKLDVDAILSKSRWPEVMPLHGGSADELGCHFAEGGTLRADRSPVRCHPLHLARGSSLLAVCMCACAQARSVCGAV